MAQRILRTLRQLCPFEWAQCFVNNNNNVTTKFAKRRVCKEVQSHGMAVCEKQCPDVSSQRSKLWYTPLGYQSAHVACCFAKVLHRHVFITVDTPTKERKNRH